MDSTAARHRGGGRPGSAAALPGQRISSGANMVGISKCVLQSTAGQELDQQCARRLGERQEPIAGAQLEGDLSKCDQQLAHPHTGEWHAHHTRGDEGGRRSVVARVSDVGLLVGKFVNKFVDKFCSLPSGFLCSLPPACSLFLQFRLRAQSVSLGAQLSIV